MKGQLKRLKDMINSIITEKPNATVSPSPEAEFDYTDYKTTAEWENLKLLGEDHHRTGGVEPIDLYRAGGILKHFAIACIIKYAFRNRNRPIEEKDLDKIVHYTQMLRVICHEGG